MILFAIRQIYHVLKGMKTPQVVRNKRLEVPFRCMPWDIDLFMHMNNASYLRLAELARWRMVGSSGMAESDLFRSGNVLFLAVENKVKYLRQVQPFKKLIVTLSCDVYKDDKWIYMRHRFEQHPDTKSGQEPKLYADVECRAVFKKRNGQTIKPSDLMEMHPHLLALCTMHDEEKEVIDW